MSKPLIQSVKEYIQTCPLLQNIPAYIDSLLDKPYTCSVEETQQEKPQVQEYLDGSSSRQFTFVLALSFDYSEEVEQNIENCSFFEQFSDWVSEQDDAGNLPDLGTNKTATGIEVLSHGYLYGISDNMQRARYQIPLRLSYDQE